MEFQLLREGSIAGIGSPGYFKAGDIEFASIEKEWLNNEPFNSCIFTGRFRLVKYNSDKYPDHYALVNEALGVYAHKEDIPKGIKGRYAILIHIANIASELAGCIAIGMRRGYVTPEGHHLGLGVSGSTTAYGILKKMLDKDEEHFLTIDVANPNW